jgi:hypothetical protein
VILHHQGKFYDFDSVLGFPCASKEYIDQALHPEFRLREEFHRFVYCDGINGRMYRLIPAEMYLENFASDRGHMLNGNVVARAPPPPWPTIQNSEGIWTA